jgi:hypothetical protein
MNFMRFGHSCDDRPLLDKAGSGSFEVNNSSERIVCSCVRLPKSKA